MKALSNCLRLLAIAVAIVTFGSCSDENDYYWSPLIGDWVLVADEYGPVDTDQNIFSFYGDGSGLLATFAAGADGMLTMTTGGSHIPTTSIGIPMERLSTSRLPTDRTGCISGLSTATICILPMSIPEVSWCLPCIERQPRPLMYGQKAWQVGDAQDSQGGL